MAPPARRGSQLTRQSAVRRRPQRVDGALLCSPRMSNDLVEQLRREVPLVLVNRLVEGLPAVVMDVAQGARDAIGHLVGLGRRDLLLLGGPGGAGAEGG